VRRMIFNLFGRFITASDSRFNRNEGFECVVEWLNELVPNIIYRVREANVVSRVGLNNNVTERMIIQGVIYCIIITFIEVIINKWFVRNRFIRIQQEIKIYHTMIAVAERTSNFQIRHN
jgi:hypothetical protein